MILFSKKNALTNRRIFYRKAFHFGGNWAAIGPVAQSVEQRTENPCVDSSILSWPTMIIKGLAIYG